MNLELPTEEKRTVAVKFGQEAAAWESYYKAGRAGTVSIQNIVTRLEIVVEFLGAGPGRLLDVGSAAGAASGVFHDRGWEVAGMDLSPEMSAYAQSRASSHGTKGLGFLAGDAERLPFPDGRFDAVVAMGLIEYCPDDDRGLDELVRVLRQGGRFVITVPNLLSPWRKLDSLIGAVERPLVPLLRTLRYGPA